MLKVDSFDLKRYGGGDMRIKMKRDVKKVGGRNEICFKKWNGKILLDSHVFF